MLTIRPAFLVLLGLLELKVLAQSSAYGQCGGINWTGARTCVSGYSCQRWNDYYSQCIPSSQVTTTTIASSTSITKSSTTISSTASSTPATTTATSTTLSSALPTATSSIGLNAAAKAAGKLYLGSATDNPELTDTASVQLLNDTTQFGAITPGNSMKWDATEKSRGVFTFCGGDVIANLAKADGQLLRGHTCVWHSQLPSWVSSGNFSAAELTSIIETHCTTIVSHYKGQTYAWDVVNEPFNEDGTFRDSVFYNTLNTSFIATALRAARAAGPATKLYINDYNLEYGGAKTNAMVALAKQLLADGVPLDGVGLQAHLIVGSTPSASSLATQLSLFTALGLDVAITELDIRMTLPATDALLAQQKKDYQSVVSACQQVARCVGVTIWHYTDKYSWIPSVFSGQGAALPWTENLVTKPAYDGIVAGFLPNGLPSTSSVPASTTTAPFTSTAPTSTAVPSTLAVGKYLGSATDNGELSDATYSKLLNDTTQFGSITPGNSMKWDATEKSRGVFTFSGGDVIANLAKANGQLLRGHTCVWHSQLPGWVSSGGFNASELTSIINTHCTTLVSHYEGQVYAWDVVNEPFNEDGTYRTSVFYNTLNTSFIATALRAARAADPAAKLYINDYNLEYGGAKTNAMAALAKQLIADSIPLDGIGFQAHLIVGSTPSATNLATQLSLFTSLGLDVAITELDIRMTLPATAALYTQQQKDYQSVIAACKSVAKCVGVTIWDYTDRYSWVPGVFSGQGAALPWDDNYVKKPAYDGIVAGFSA